MLLVLLLGKAGGSVAQVCIKECNICAFRMLDCLLFQGRKLGKYFPHTLFKMETKELVGENILINYLFHIICEKTVTNLALSIFVI
jgi:hypothetical protein